MDWLDLFSKHAVGEELTTEELNQLIFGMYAHIRKLEKQGATAVRMTDVTAGDIRIEGATVNYGR